MEEGLLLNRIQMDSAGIAVHEAVILPIPVLTDSAIASFPVGNAASPGT